MTFSQKLHSIQQRNNALFCVGLDSDINKIPNHLLQCENPILEFNRRIIEVTKDLVCAYKLNLAFYETLGEIG